MSTPFQRLVSKVKKMAEARFPTTREELVRKGFLKFDRGFLIGSFTTSKQSQRSVVSSERSCSGLG